MCVGSNIIIMNIQLKFNIGYYKIEANFAIFEQPYSEVYYSCYPDFCYFNKIQTELT